MFGKLVFVLLYLSSLFFLLKIKFKNCIFIISLLVFFMFLVLWFFYDFNSETLQFFCQVSDFFFFQFSIDGISLFFILLTTFFFPLIFLEVWLIKLLNIFLLILLLSLELLLVVIFTTADFFMFYIAFELILIPMIFIIGFWGVRSRRIKAIFYFFLYTFIGSLLMLIGLILIYFELGTTNFFFLKFYSWSLLMEKILWFLFFFSFAVKVPLFPFHIWLPEAHVEAPTFGSVLLAAVLLKMGGYGFIKILLSLFALGSLFFLPLLIIFCFLGLIYSSLLLLCQIDIKKIIAYSSVAHMNFAILGLFSYNLESFQGSFFLMISHGFSSGALFFLIGILYNRFSTRLIFYYSGLIQIMPLFNVIFFFFILVNFGFPGTANFIGEFLVFINFFYLQSFFLLILLFWVLFCSLIYNILLYIRLSFGMINVNFFSYLNFLDLSRRELVIFIPLICLSLFFGLFPSIIFQSIEFFFFTIY